MLVSCKKKEEDRMIRVDGTVVNELTGQPIGGLTVSLTESCGGGASLAGSGWAVIRSVDTDSEGRYSFNEKVSDCGGWKVDINATPNYNSSYSTDWFQVRPNEAVRRTTQIYRNATLHVNAKTNNPLGTGDDFFMNLPGIGCRCSNLTSTRAKGGFKNVITWRVTRNLVQTAYSDSVLCPVDEERTYEITY